MSNEEKQVKVGAIQAEFDENRKRLEALYHQVSVLENSLEPVLSPVPNEPAGEPAKKIIKEGNPTTCELLERLARQEYLMRDIRRKLSSIQDRLEI